MYIIKIESVLFSRVSSAACLLETSRTTEAFERSRTVSSVNRRRVGGQGRGLPAAAGSFVERTFDRRSCCSGKPIGVDTASVLRIRSTSAGSCRDSDSVLQPAPMAFRDTVE